MKDVGATDPTRVTRGSTDPTDPCMEDVYGSNGDLRTPYIYDI